MWHLFTALLPSPLQPYLLCLQYFVVQHLPQAAVQAPDKSTCVLLESGPHKDLPAAQQHAGQQNNVSVVESVEVMVGKQAIAVVASMLRDKPFPDKHWLLGVQGLPDSTA